MGYAMLFAVMGVAILYLAYCNFVLAKKFKQARMVATLLIAEKVGAKVDGKEIKIKTMEVTNVDA